MVPVDQELLIQQQQQQQMVEQENPFNLREYENVPVPDAPVQYGGNMVDALLNDREVPEEIREKWWFIFHKDNVLTFLDEERKRSKMINFDILKIDMLNSLPYYDYDFDLEMKFSVLRNVFETKLDRALGTKTQSGTNERKILQSQFTEQRQIQELGNTGMIKEGFFKRLLRRK